jgi:uncharacterized membrane protein
MFLTLVGLLGMLLAIRAISWCVRAFWAWLGRGKELRRLANNEQLDEGVKLQIATAHAWRVARRSEVTIRRNVPHHLNAQQRHAVRKAVINARDEFLDATPLGWWQVIMIFFFCSILGLVLEEIWMLITAGLTESRVGLVWGPFSPLYGVGAVLLTFMAYQLRRHHAKNWHVFFAAVAVGGVLEQGCGWGMEHLLHAQSWSYAHLPDHITDYVAWRFLFMWGLLGIVWARLIMPELLYRIGVFHSVRQYAFIALLAAYLTADIAMTVACFDRKVERDAGIPPSNRFEVWVDEHYTDQFIARRFENLVIDTDHNGAR